MKKVCVSTYCEWTSYGSILQAVALKKTLSDLDCESFIVRDKPAPPARKSFPIVLSKNPKVMINQFLSLKIAKQREDMYQKSVSFIRCHTDIVYYNDFSTLSKRIPQADYYLAGSDQIWHPHLCKPVFFLDFLPPEARRLSYAASMGVTKVPMDKETLFGGLISKFDTVSVREKEMQAILGQYTDKPIRHHIDPTFLLGAEQWRQLSSPYPLVKPYILVFAIYWDKQLNNQLKKLHKKTGYDIVVLCPGERSFIWANKKIYDADPGEFLYLIDHAQAVVSSSFHGVALALNLNKRVAAVINPNASSRLSSLLSVLGVPSVAIDEVMDFDLSLYEQINQRIAEEKQKSLDYLKEELA